MQNAQDDWATGPRRAIAALVCALTLMFALYAGAVGGLSHAVQFGVARGGDLIDRPASAPAATPAEPMWLTVPCRRMLKNPMSISELNWCAQRG